MIKAYGEYLRTGPKRGGIIQTIFGKFVNMKYQSKINYFTNILSSLPYYYMLTLNNPIVVSFCNLSAL